MGNQLIQQYPPKNWTCSSCGKKHSKAHYSVPGQIDYTKKPKEPGRILFNRRKSQNDSLSIDTPIDHSKPMKGEQVDEHNIQRPLYCPHSPIDMNLILNQLVSVLRARNAALRTSWKLLSECLSSQIWLTSSSMRKRLTLRRRGESYSISSLTGTGKGGTGNE